MGTINSSDRIAVTLYCLGTGFVLGIYVYIPCIKEIVSLPIIIIIIIIIIITTFGYYPPKTHRRIPSRHKSSFLSSFTRGAGHSKGKAIPLQPWTGPEGSRRLRLPDFKTIENMNVVRLSALRTGRLYPPSIIPGTHFC
jgi:hypothetical protein